jgi:hypothetical protein
MGSVQQCPECGGRVNVLATACPGCGYNFATKTMPAQPAASSSPGAAHDYSGIEGEAKEGRTVGYGIVMGIFVILALFMLSLGLFSPSLSAVQQTSCLAAAAVFGIFARLAQAGGHHAKLMHELRRR